MTKGSGPYNPSGLAGLVSICFSSQKFFTELCSCSLSYLCVDQPWCGGFVFSLKVSLIPLTSPEALGCSVQIMWWWRFFVPLWKHRRGCLGRVTVKRWAAEISKIGQIKDLATTGDIHYTHYIIQCGFKAKHKYMCKNSPSLRVQQVSTTA